MTPIQPIINLGDSGAPARHLREALLLLLNRGAIHLWPMHAAEIGLLQAQIRAEQNADLPYGRSTRELVRVIQLVHRWGTRRGQLARWQFGLCRWVRKALDIGGDVDEWTALWLNHLLDSESSDDSFDGYVVEGRLIDEKGRALPQRHVVLFEQDINGPTRLGLSTTTSADGRYRFRFSKADYADGDFGQAPPGRPEAPSMAQHMPAPGREANPMLSGPDVWVGVGEDEHTVTARTPIVFNAGTRTTMPDLVLPREVLYAGLSDLERVEGLVRPRLKGLLPDALTDAQIDFLAQDCEEPLALVGAFVLAHRSVKLAQAQAAELAHSWSDQRADAVLALQFAAAADNQARAWDQLVLLPDDAVRGILRNGLARRRVPAPRVGDVDDFVNWLGELRRLFLRARDTKPGGEPVRSTPADLIAIALPEDSPSRDELGRRSADIARWMADPAVRKPTSRARLAEDLALPPEQAAPLHTAIRLNDLAGGQPAVVRLLWPLVKDHLAPEPLAALAGADTIEWINVAHGVAGGLSPGTDPSTYGRSLATRVELLMPAPTLCHRLASSEAFQDLPLYRGLAGRLEACPDLDLMDAAPDELAGQLDISKAEVSALAGLRQFKLADWTWRDAERAVAAGVTSLDDVWRLGKEGVASRLQAAGGSAVDPGLVAQLSNVATYVMTQAAGTINTLWAGSTVITSPGVRPDGQGSEAKEEESKVRELFQLGDCACDPCLSMLSPAAYRADLLAFLEASVDDEQLLDERLGHAKDLQFSCDNTNIEKVQLDLVIEQMENAIALPFSVTLPAGQTPEQQAVEPNLGRELRDALRSTTDLEDSQFGPFSVSVEAVVGPAAAQRTTWLIADAARHWRVRSLGSLLSSSDFTNRVAPSADLGPLVDALEAGGSLDLAGLAPLVGMMRSAVGARRLPLAVVSAQVLSRASEAGDTQRWTLRVSAEGQVSIAAGFAGAWAASELSAGFAEETTGDGGLTWLAFTSPTGGWPAPLRLLRGLSPSAMAAQLSSTSRLPPDVLADLELEGEPPITLSETAQRSWRYTVTRTIELVYRPARLDVISLTYQSTQALDAGAVEPVHRNRRAYAELNARTFPWSLPFDESLNHARALLRASGLERRALQEAALSRRQWQNSEAWVLEVLGLSPQAARHIASDLEVDALRNTWGLKRFSPNLPDQFMVFDGLDGDFVGGRDEELLSRVSIVMQQSRVSFGELRVLLAMQYVNPGLAVTITPIDECDPVKLRLTGPVGSITPLCRRLYRFVQLQRALRWPAHELDAALSLAAASAAGLGDWNRVFRVLANLKLLHEQLGVPVDMLADWLGADFALASSVRVDAQDGVQSVNSPFERVFQNLAVRNPADELLRADQFQPRNLTPGDHLPRHLLRLEALSDGIAAALGVRQTELREWMEVEVADLEPVRRDLNQGLLRGENGLLAICRNVLLARAVGLDVAEYAAASRLLGTSPFRLGPVSATGSEAASSRTAELLRWCRDIAFVRSTGLSFQALEWALSPSTAARVSRQGPPGALAVSPADAATLLSSLQKELRATPAGGETPIEPLNFSGKPWPLPAIRTEDERWLRWGLKPSDPGRWATEDPKDPNGTLKGDAMALLSRLDVLAFRLGHSLGHTRELLESTYVALGTLNLPARPTGQIQGLTMEHLDRLETFAALQAASGLPAMVVDLAIEALFPTVAMGQMANELAALRALAERTGLGPGWVVAFWCGFSARVYTTYQDDDPATPLTTGPLFARTLGARSRWVLATDRTLDKPPAHWLEEDASRQLAEALRVDRAELVALVEHEAGLPPPSLNGLTEVHRWLSLGRALRMPVLLQRVCRDHIARELPALGRPFDRPTALLAFLDQVERVRPRMGLVIERMAASASLDVPLAAHLLSSVLKVRDAGVEMSGLEHLLHSSFVASTTTFEASTMQATPEFDLLQTLQRCGWLNATWRLDRLTMRWLPSSTASGFGNPGLSSATPDQAFAAWKEATALLELVRDEPAMRVTLEAYRERRVRPGNAADIRSALAPVAAAFGLDPAFIARLATRVALDERSSRDPGTLVAFLGLARMCAQLGINRIEDLESLLDSPAPLVDSTAAKAARAVLLARHGVDGAGPVLAEAARTVRIDRRDRLVGYLVWRDDLATPDDLVGRLSCDPLQSDARRISRELHASGCAQLWLNRCLMGLEPAVSPDRFDPARVQVMRSGVVRNASLNVWLFAWRYLLPEFNDDRSEALITFENALSQDEATLPNVHQAMRRYVDDLIELTNLKVVSMHIGRDQRGRRVLYQLGRTRSQPYDHYWRTCLHYQRPGMRWTGWLRIDVPIDGEWPVMFVHQQVLHIAWPILSEAKSDGDSPKWAIQIACVRHLSGRWTQRKLSNEGQFDGEPGLQAAQSIFIDCLPAGNEAVLRIFTVKAANEFRRNAVRPNEGQDGPFWIGNAPNRTKYKKVPQREVFVSVNLRVWLGYKWSPSPGTQAQHYEAVGSASLTVFVRLTVYEKPKAIPLPTKESELIGKRVYWSPAFPDAEVNRPVAKFLLDSNHVDGWVPRVEIEVSAMSGSARLVKTFFWTRETNIINAGQADHVFDIDHVFDVADEPPAGKLARQSASPQPWRQVTIDPDGLPTLLLGQPSPGPLAYIPTATRVEGTRFAEESPAAGHNQPIMAAGQGGDGLAVLGPQSDPVYSFELLSASSSSVESNTSIWWFDEGDAAGLVDSSGGSVTSTPRLLPSSSQLLLAWRDAAKSDVAQLLGDPKRLLEREPATAVLPAWTSRYLPAGLEESRTPARVTKPFFDPRFLHTRDFRELQVDLAWSAVSVAEQQQRLDVARELLRLLYDPWTPTTSSSPRRWHYYPISESANPPSRLALLSALSSANGDPELKRQAEMQIAMALDDPFNPYNIARLRPSELKIAILAATARNQGALGDALFLRFSNESVDRARLHYISMAQLLPPRPPRLASRAVPPAPKSYRQLAASRQGASSLSAHLGTGVSVTASAAASTTAELDPDQRAAVHQLLSLTTGYFCVPRDDALEELWDFVADRLYKLRNGQNIRGEAQTLPPIDPPIDPVLLIRATRAGLSIDEALSELYAPPSHLRFQARFALAQEVISASLPLSAAAWSAQEEADNERLMAMRADHELALLRLTTQIRLDEVREADANIDALKQERETLRNEIRFLNRQLGHPEPSEDGEGIPIVDGGLRVSVIDSLHPSLAGETGVGGLGLSAREGSQLEWLNVANNYAIAGAGFRSSAHVAHILGVVSLTKVEEKAALAAAHGLDALADLMSGLGSNASTWERWQGLMAGFERRHDQIKQEMLSRVSRMKENGKRLVAAEIRRAIADRAHKNLLEDIEHKRQEHEYIHSGKFATEATKRWARRKAYELSQAGFRLAVEQAMMAWQAWRHECGDPSLPPPETRAWDHRYLGRFALETLQQSLLRMKVAYESRAPELEITAHVSLRQLSPQALVNLRYNGSCEFEITEFDLNRSMPSPLIFQRIKALSLSLPCVVGPYTGVHAKLTILSNRYRCSDRVRGGNVMSPENFRAAFVPRTSLLTSGAQNDGGMFEVNLRGEQLLVGEGAGLAQCRIKLELPADTRPFDYRTISDLVLHIRYTAREGRPELSAALSSLGRTTPGKPSAVLLSCRSDFSQAWHQAVQTNGSASIQLDASLLPYWLADRVTSQGAAMRLKAVRWVDVPGALDWKRGEIEDPPSNAGTTPKVMIARSLELPCQVHLTDIQPGLEDRLLLLEFE